MAILFQSETGRPDGWITALEGAFPHLPVHVFPGIGDAGAIRYAVVWRPPAGLLGTLPNLRGILNLGAGIDGILADPALPAGVPVVRMVNRGLTEGMVEYVAWQVLDWHRNGPHYRAAQVQRRWRPAEERLARHRSVGIMGLGVLGQAVAEALLALGFRVVGWARTVKTVPGVETFAGSDGLAAFLDRSACLVCLLPLTPETRGCLNAALFRRLPPGAHLINVARGEHLVEADLLPALAAGRPASAVLDVMAHEPLGPDHPFWGHPAITLTPHVAAQTHLEDSAPGIIQAIRDLEAGRVPDGTVDRVRGY